MHGSLSGAQLIKVVLAITKVPACRPLLEAAASQASNRVAEIPPAQLILLMQGLLPLGGQHHALVRMLDQWAFSFAEATRIENLIGPDMVSQRRADLEAKGQLSADQLAKLAQVLAPSMPDHKAFWEALGRRVSDMPSALSAAGMAALDAAFPNGAGPSFPAKERMLRMVRQEKKEREGGGSKEDRERDGRDAAIKDREREVKDRDRERERDGRGLDRDRGASDRRRDAAREKELEKEREAERKKELEKEKEREKERKAREKAKEKEEKEKAKEREKEKAREKEAQAAERAKARAKEKAEKAAEKAKALAEEMVIESPGKAPQEKRKRSASQENAKAASAATAGRARRARRGQASVEILDVTDEPVDLSD